jgi:two-component system phosphate regulon sensor histidine kinase PhoR
MKRQAPPSHRSSKHQATNNEYDWHAQFERVTRQLRWLVLFSIVIAFPYSEDRAGIVVATLIAATLYNFSRYTRFVLNNKLLASPLTIIITDGMYVGLMVMIVGSPMTAFSTYFIYMVITAAYRYGLLASLAIFAAEFSWLAAVWHFQWFAPLYVSQTRGLIVFGFVLLGLSLLSYRLTYIDVRERETLRLLGRKSEAERAHLLAFVNSMIEGIFVVDDTGKILMYNDSAAVMIGTDELRNREFHEVVPLFQRKDAEEKPVHLFDGKLGNVRRRDLCLKTAAGQRMDLDIIIKKVKLSRGSGTDYIVVCEDITGERSLDEERSEFISVASHELRTPIAVMEAALSTALHSKKPLPEETRQLVKQAHDNAAYLAGIMKDLSTLAEARNDNIPIQMERIDVKALVHGLGEDFALAAKQKGLRFEVQVADDAPDCMSTERHIREVLQNYITNAIKYSQEGEVHLRADRAANGGVVFSVTDTGIGIAPKDQKYLFTKFFRAEDYRTQTTNGTGLGLYLCQELAKRIGAKVWCESVLNKGSMFCLEVPPFSGRGSQGETVTERVAKLFNKKL